VYVTMKNSKSPDKVNYLSLNRKEEERERTTTIEFFLCASVQLSSLWHFHKVITAHFLIAMIKRIECLMLNSCPQLYD
jgi:hypothetical protein